MSSLFVALFWNSQTNVRIVNSRTFAIQERNQRCWINKMFDEYLINLMLKEGRDMLKRMGGEVNI